MSIQLTELSRYNTFLYNTYTNNQIIGYDGYITSGSVYISNRSLYTSMLIDYQSYDKSISRVEYLCESRPVNSILVIKGYDTKFEGNGGGPQHRNSLMWKFIPANIEQTIAICQTPTNTSDFYIYRIVF